MKSDTSMKTAAISRLKAKLSEYISSVKRGEEVIITERGRPVARIIPIEPELDMEERTRDLIKRGLMRPGRGGDLRARLKHLPIVSLPEGLIQQVMEEERDEPW